MYDIQGRHSLWSSTVTAKTGNSQVPIKGDCASPRDGRKEGTHHSDILTTLGEQI